MARMQRLLLLPLVVLVVLARADANGAAEDSAYDELIALLRTGDIAERRSAARDLSKYVPDDQMIPALAAACADEDSGVRRCAVMSLQRLGPVAKAVVPVLRELIGGEDREVAVWAASALATVGRDPQTAVSVMTRALESSDAAVRRWAALALGELGSDGKAAVGALLTALDDDNRAVRSLAREAVLRIGVDADVLLARLDALMACKDPDVRMLAVFGVGNMGRRARHAAPRLVAMFEDADPHVRWSAADALMKIADGGASPGCRAGFIDGLACDDPYVRSQCAIMLGMLDVQLTQAAEDRLRAMMTGDKGRPRVWAAYAVAASGREPAEPTSTVVAFLQDEDPEVREAAVLAVGKLASRIDDAAALITMMLRDDAPMVRLAATAAIRELGTGAESAAPALLKAIVDERWSGVSMSACSSLRQILFASDRTLRGGQDYDDVLVGRLRALLRSPDKFHRGTAAAALGLMEASDDSIAALQEALTDSDADVRLGAACTLWKLGATEADTLHVLRDFLLGREKREFSLASIQVSMLWGDPDCSEQAVDRILRAHLMDRNKELRVHIANAMLRRDRADSTAWQVLLELIADPNPSIRVQAVGAVADLGSPIPPQAVVAVAEALADKDPSVRYYACRALREAGPVDDTVLGALEALRSDTGCIDGHRYVQDAALEAIRSIRSRAAPTGNPILGGKAGESMSEAVDKVVPAENLVPGGKTSDSSSGDVERTD